MPHSSYLQWVHETYESQWKGTVDIRTVAGEDHAPQNPHWCCAMTASGAVVQQKSGKHVTLETILVEADGRTKKEAEQKAAEKTYNILVEQGWYDPNSPPRPKKSGSVSRATRFLIDATMSNEANPLAYLDVSIGGQPVGRIVFELFRYKKGSTQDPHAPLAVANFLALCQGVEVAGHHLRYAGVPFTRIIRRFIIQAGDVVNKDGTGGAHIHTSYGEHFPDEGLDDRCYRHLHPFMLSAANLGLEDTNSSQFIITTAPAAQLDGYHTCFGKLLAGFGVVKEIESLCGEGGSSSAADHTPPCLVIIEAAGELPAGTIPTEVAPPVSAAGYPLWPEDLSAPPEGTREAEFRLNIANKLKELGNTAYKQEFAATALARYQQAIRYLSWTSFKVRMVDGDVDLTPQEQRNLWDGEVVLMGNLAAAQIKLGRFREAADMTDTLLLRTPNNVKALLRAGQAHMGLGSAEYDTAARLLREALAKAQEQQLPTWDIVAELHHLRDLQQQHTAQQKAKFSAAFAAGLLHHPADDDNTSANSDAAGAYANGIDCSGGVGSLLKQVSVGTNSKRAKLPAVTVPQERILDDASKPVMVEDAWGHHLLVADETNDSSIADTSNLNWGGVGGADSRDSYTIGLMRRLAKLGLTDSRPAGTGDPQLPDRFDKQQHQYYNDEYDSSDEGYLEDEQQQDGSVQQQADGVVDGNKDEQRQLEDVVQQHIEDDPAVDDAPSVGSRRYGDGALAAGFRQMRLA